MLISDFGTSPLFGQQSKGKPLASVVRKGKVISKETVERGAKESDAGGVGDVAIALQIDALVRGQVGPRRRAIGGDDELSAFQRLRHDTSEVLGERRQAKDVRPRPFLLQRLPELIRNHMQLDRKPFHRLLEELDALQRMPPSQIKNMQRFSRLLKRLNSSLLSTVNVEEPLEVGDFDIESGMVGANPLALRDAGRLNDIGAREHPMFERRDERLLPSVEIPTDRIIAAGWTDDQFRADILRALRGLPENRQPGAVNVDDIDRSGNLVGIVREARVVSVLQLLGDELPRSIRHAVPSLEPRTEMHDLHATTSFQYLPRKRRVAQSDRKVLPSKSRPRRSRITRSRQ